jgi:hypothetical protein
MAASHCSRRLSRCLSRVQRNSLRVADPFQQSSGKSLRAFADNALRGSCGFGFGRFARSISIEPVFQLRRSRMEQSQQ